MSAEDIKNQILALTRQYYSEKFGSQQEYQPGGRVNYAGRVFDEKELVNLVDSSLEFWLTAGRYTREFESGLAHHLGVKYCSLVNSGSSANLLAFSALTAPELGKRQIHRGDEVITVAAGFPTTVAPIVQYGAVPVFVDVTIPQYNLDVQLLEQAYSNKTKAVMVAHTLGNPFDVVAVREFCDKHGLWMIEDNCDALGSRIRVDSEWKYTGTMGDLGTSSFYPPHHITMGEGGAVYTNNEQLYRLVNSFRDWGRDCYCPPGADGTCQHRFEGQYGELPRGYDHKYVYSHFGYNLKATDMQAAIGCAQLEKLELFASKRKENWNYLRQNLEGLSNALILPQAAKDSEPSWFGFLITVRETAAFTRNELVNFLETSNIQTRNLFAGNLVKHPCFNEMRYKNCGFRIAGTLDNTDYIMNHSFWLGVYPGMTKEKLDYMILKIREFIRNKEAQKDA